MVVGADRRGGSTEARVWLLRGDGLERAELPDEVAGGRPSASVVTPVATEDGYVAIGSASASPVAWSSTDFADWTAAGLPGRSAASASISVSDADLLAGGDTIAVGQIRQPLGSDAGVWLGQGSGTWEQLDGPSFSNRGGSGYGTVEPTSVAVGKRTVVVAANSYVNGAYEAHPLVSPASGRSWSDGAGESSIPLTDSDRYHDRTPYPAFRAPANGSIFMNEALALRSGFVIGGSRGGSGEGAQAVVWSSRDGRTWGDPRELPRPADAYASEVSLLTRSGSTVVAVGQVQATPDDTGTGWASWVSTNGGRTWRVGEVVAPGEINASAVMAVPGGFLVLGSTGPSDNLEAAAWTSTDGTTWVEVDLDLERGSGPGNQFLAGGLVEDDQLRLVGSDVPPAGGGYYSVSVDVPTP